MLPKNLVLKPKDQKSQYVMISILEISYEKEDVTFTKKLDIFSIGTIKIPTHIEPVSKTIHILDLRIAKHVPKQPVDYYVF
jgi:hypothetical protein